jgi:hypothetical protein
MYFLAAALTLPTTQPILWPRVDPRNPTRT